MAQTKLDSLKPGEYTGSKILNKVTLKSIIDGMKTLLQVLRYDMKVSIEENNEIPTVIRIEITIKNLR